MTAKAVSADRYLFLQGPIGPLFDMLAKRMAAVGIGICRINLCGGDAHDWKGPATDYTGRMSGWPEFFDHYIQENGVTDLMLFGDCRPYHAVAIKIARIRNIRIHVLEEGYIRPDWMTLEQGGVNGHSALPKDPSWFLDQASLCPPVPEEKHITASFKRRTRDGFHHYTAQFFGRFKYRHYVWHRPGNLWIDAWLWGRKLARQRWAKPKGGDLAEFLAVEDRPFFLLPLQLSADYQIRIHSPFPDMVSAVSYIMDNFRDHAPPECRLLVKSHPLYAGFFEWGRYIERQARRLGIEDRVQYVEGGDLRKMCIASEGMVCVNSTSATLALEHGRPVYALGQAVYDIEGLTQCGPLDNFWKKPVPPDKKLFDAFKRVLVGRYLVRGGLSSESAILTLADSIMDRLFPGCEESLVKANPTADGLLSA